ncbi:filamentous hemagglutinin family outer membrane protein [[Leptolyngbya] sp. PCC 7376]|uniref:two-partner secretion domain-containing protein n=1 Tax=[Leptolyngbya] sp. PCC 7376 TaxID=111781 RepID=UPI00029EC8EE|nr:filamentous hemagglutinin N-terminal domain-containing protein [[Leptolyngbya] sp. PCC 7376]AFY39802.1 filamentous hemagglutinin family outer membrane protein [[Leptolyngbya] sp. PCC 7376]
MATQRIEKSNCPIAALIFGGLCLQISGFSSMAIAQSMPPGVGSPPSITGITIDQNNTTNTLIRNSIRGEPRDSIIIDQGLLSNNGANLFHSFGEFGISSNESVYFDAQGANRIISRVTGDSASIINGSLNVLNDAMGGSDFYLLNPKGLSFGPDASLDLQGAFIGSTAEAIKFADNTVFSAVSNHIPLLTVTAPIGLQFGQNPAPILLNQVNISLDEAQEFMLYGGDITLNGSDVNFGSTQNPVEILFVSVGEAGTVRLPNGINRTLTSIKSLGDLVNPAIARGDITITNGSIVNTLNGGSLNFIGRNFALLENSQLFAPLDGAVDGGDIFFNFQNVRIEDSLIGLVTRNGSSGNGGSFIVETKTFNLSDSLVTTDTLSDGNGGLIRIMASDFVRLVASGADTSQPVGLTSGTRVLNNVGGDGDGGLVIVETKDLFIINGAQINTSTSTGGEGGRIFVNATGDVVLESSVERPSSIQSISNSDASNVGGGVKVLAKNLRVLDGSQISASTFSGANGGNVEVVVTEQALISGINTQLEDNTQDSSFFFDRGILPSGIFSVSESSGDAGNVFFHAGESLITQGAQISVSNVVGGGAGSINISGDRLFADNSFIKAEASAGDDANINFDLSEFVFFSNENFVSSNAIGNATGGNITFNVGFLLASNNSDITANSANSEAGQVTVNATGVYGAVFREMRTPDSDITASSRLGVEFDGVVTLNVLDVDPVSSVAKLPVTLNDPSNLITDRCDVARVNTFTTSGRGGIPTSPDNLLSADAWTDWRRSPTMTSFTKHTPIVSTQSQSIRQVTKWERTPEGHIQLFAQREIENPWRSPEKKCRNSR